MPSEIWASRSGSGSYIIGDKTYEYYITSHYKFYDLLSLENKLDDSVLSKTTGKIGSRILNKVATCTNSGAESEMVVRGLTSKQDVICTGRFYFNQHEIITPN